MRSGKIKLIRNSLLLLSVIATQGCLEVAKKYEQGVNVYKSTVDKYTGKSNQQQPQQNQQQAKTNTAPGSQPGSSSVASVDPNTKQIMQQVRWWHKREPYFKDLPFDGGNYKVIKAPSDKFADLYIPMHKGLPRVGLTQTFGINKLKQNDHRNDPHLYTKMAFTEKLERDMNTYIVLKYMSMNKNLFKIGLLIFLAVCLAAGAAAADDIKARMKKRLPTINKLKAQGLLGENKNGILQYRSGNQPHRAMVDAENADRLEIYSRIARQQNVSPERVGARRAIQIAKRAKPGTWLQKADGTWYRK